MKLVIEVIVHATEDSKKMNSSGNGFRSRNMGPMNKPNMIVANRAATGIKACVKVVFLDFTAIR